MTQQDNILEQAAQAIDFAIHFANAAVNTDRAKSPYEITSVTQLGENTKISIANVRLHGKGVQTGKSIPSIIKRLHGANIVEIEDSLDVKSIIGQKLEEPRKTWRTAFNDIEIDDRITISRSEFGSVLQVISSKSPDEIIGLLTDVPNFMPEETENAMRIVGYNVSNRELESRRLG